MREARLKNARLVSNKIMKSLVGGPLLVGGLGSRPPWAPLKSGPVNVTSGEKRSCSEREFKQKCLQLVLELMRQFRFLA